MVTLRRIGIRSAGRLGFWVGVALAITLLTFILSLAFFLGGLRLTELGLDFWLEALRYVVTNGLSTAFTFGMFSFIYNLISKTWGGLELEFEPIPTQTEKRKNDDNPNVKKPVDIE